MWKPEHRRAALTPMARRSVTAKWPLPNRRSWTLNGRHMQRSRDRAVKGHSTFIEQAFDVDKASQGARLALSLKLKDWVLQSAAVVISTQKQSANFEKRGGCWLCL